MPWSEALEPARMERVALVAPVDRLRSVLAAVADAGVVQLEGIEDAVRGEAAEALARARRAQAEASVSRISPGAAQHDATRAAPPAAVRTLPPTAARTRQRTAPPTTPRIAARAAPFIDAEPVDLAVLEREGRLGELAGEAELEKVRESSLRRGSVAALVGWSPVTARGPLAGRLASLGGAVVPLRPPLGSEPPTLVEAGRATHAFQPLVDTYATLGYRDLNPAVVAGLAYVVMFGMMFGDVGHGVLLVAAGLLMRAGRPAFLARVRHLAPFVIGAGLASVGFGFAFGEAFGPTGLPALWLDPLDKPTTLLAAAIAVGAGLLACSYVLGVINRWREGGPAHALVATSGIAGALLYVGLAVVGLGWWQHVVVAEVAGGVLVAAGLGFAFVGFFAEAGGRVVGMFQAGIELFDAVVRIGTNTVSFARLAAFGLTHAALAGIVWRGTTGLWHRGAVYAVAAAALFVVGNAVAFCLEGLVAGVQALRLEYYELFSRIFTVEGRKFRPWHVPIVRPKEAPCSPG